MKTNLTVKTLLFTLIYAFFGIGTILFAKEVMKKENVKQVEKPVVLFDWVLVGTDPTNASHYAKENPNSPAPCPGLPQAICKIQAPEDAFGQPDMSAASGSSTVGDQIDDALESLQPGNTPTLNDAVLAFRSTN